MPPPLIEEAASSGQLHADFSLMAIEIHFASASLSQGFSG